MEIVLCSNCSYPIAAALGQSVKCPYCDVSGTVIDQTEVEMKGKPSGQVQTRIGGPGPLDFFLGLLLGMVFGPAIKEAAEKGLRHIP